MVTVRAATPEDVAGIRRVARAGWRAAYEGLMAESAVETALAEYYDRETVERAVRAEEVVYLVAAADDGADEAGAGEGVVGYAAGTDAEGGGPGTAVLSAIYVRPDRWGEGVGGALFEDLRGRLRERGFERVRATVLAENGAGRPFYDAYGFEPVEEREESVAGERHRALVVERAL